MGARRTDVTVIIPTYNRARLVGQAVQSALAQTLPPQKVIVVDDGSSDGTAEVLRPFADRIEILRQDNAGVSSARNRGLEATSTPLVCFLDSDDELLPGALEQAVPALRPDAGAIIFSARCKPDREGNGVLRTKTTPGDFYDFQGLFGKDQGWCIPTGVFRKAAVRQCGGFDEELRGAEDYLLLLCLLAEGMEVQLLRDPVFLRMEGDEHDRLSGSTLRNMRTKLQALERFQELHPDVVRDHSIQVRTLRAKFLSRLARSLLCDKGLSSETRNEARQFLWRAFRQRPIRVEYLIEYGWLALMPRSYDRLKAHRHLNRGRTNGEQARSRPPEHSRSR